MSKFKIGVLILLALCFAVPAFAVDGVVLINQATVTAAGGFPYKITQSGSYKLSGNLVDTAAGTDGILIMADNVTIDLNGFTISGPAVCSGSITPTCSFTDVGGVGIESTYLLNGLPQFANNVTVRNGMVRGFADGLHLAGIYNIVEEIVASWNAGDGIVALHALVRRNVASSNGRFGILANDSTVVENVADGNVQYGLFAQRSIYGSNTFSQNGLGAVYPTGGIDKAFSQGNNYCGPTAPC